jgi:hypothetical protein
MFPRGQNLLKTLKALEKISHPSIGDFKRGEDSGFIMLAIENSAAV